MSMAHRWELVLPLKDAYVKNFSAPISWMRRALDSGEAICVVDLFSTTVSMSVLLVQVEVEAPRW